MLMFLTRWRCAARAHWIAFLAGSPEFRHLVYMALLDLDEAEDQMRNEVCSMGEALLLRDRFEHRVGRVFGLIAAPAHLSRHGRCLDELLVDLPRTTQGVDLFLARFNALEALPQLA